MSEETTVAVATLSDAGSSVSSSTPASTPSSGTATETPLTQAPVTTAAEVKPFDASTFERMPNEDNRSYLKRAAEARAAAEKQVPANPEEAKPEEVKPEPETKPEVKPEETKPEAEAKPEEKAEDDVDSEPFALDDRAPLPPRELYAKLKEDPDLDAKLTALGIKDQLFQGQRLAAKAIAYLDTFPGGVEDAQYAKQQAETFGRFDDLITSVKTQGLEAVDKIMGEMLALDYVVGDDGQPIRDDKGNPVQQGNVQAFVEQLGTLTFNSRIGTMERLAQEALKANPENEAANNLLAAVEILKTSELLNGPVAEELTEAQKAKAAELESRENTLRREQEQRDQAEYQGREDRIGVETDTQVNTAIEAVLAKTDLPKEQWPLILSEARNAAAEHLLEDRLFTSKRDWIMRARYSPSVEKQRIAHSVNSTKAALFGSRNNGILAKTLNKYGVKMMSQQQERRNKIDTQIQAQRSETKGTSHVAPAPRPLSNDQVREKAIENIRSQGGDPSDSRTLLREMVKLRAQGA